MKNIFVKQSYTSFKVLFGMVFFICLILTILTAVRNKQLQYSWILFDAFVMIFCIIISKLLDGFGLYINNQNIYYKKISRKIQRRILQLVKPLCKLLFLIKHCSP